MVLKEEIKRALEEIGYLPLKQVQSEAIPLIDSGKNVLIQAETGSGKTAAFLIPLIHSIDPKSEKTSALIIAPTRELAIQINHEAEQIATYTGVHTVVVVGGLDRQKQENALRHRPHIIIGTCGRILDLQQSGLINFTDLKYLVLDEADLIYSTGQAKEADLILKLIPDVQRICTSATGKNMARRFLAKDTVELILNQEQLNQHIDAYYIETSHKETTLDQLLLHLPITSAMLFVSMKSEAEKISKHLKMEGILAEDFSSAHNEKSRLKIISRFQNGDIRILVATDAAARGLDLPDVSHIIHYDLPIDYETYIHRSGRTAHQGGNGISILLMNYEEKESDIGRKIIETANVFHINESITSDLSVPISKTKKQKTSAKTYLIRAGRKDKIRPKDIIGTLCAIMDFAQIGKLEIQDNYSLVDIYDDTNLKNKNKIKIKGKEKKIEKAKKKN